METACDKAAEIVEPAIRAEGYELVDIELKNEGGGRILRLFIDRPEVEEGINLDDCQRVSRLVGPLLDVEDAIEGRYFLEVSSPGVNRRIKKIEDFERFVGGKVKIRTSSPIDGRRKFTGIIGGVENGEVILKSNSSEGEQVSRIPIAVIGKASLQIL